MGWLFCYLITMVFVVCISIGIFLFFCPILAIELQKKFYENINWKITPISMAKEIRNTRVMGLFLTVSSIAAMIYLFLTSLKR